MHSSAKVKARRVRNDFNSGRTSTAVINPPTGNAARIRPYSYGLKPKVLNAYKDNATLLTPSENPYNATPINNVLIEACPQENRSPASTPCQKGSRCCSASKVRRRPWVDAMHRAEQAKASTLISSARAGPTHTNNAGPRDADNTEMPVRENIALADASTRRAEGMTTCMIAWRYGLKNCATVLLTNNNSSTPTSTCIASRP